MIRDKVRRDFQPRKATWSRGTRVAAAFRIALRGGGSLLSETSAIERGDQVVVHRIGMA